MIPISIKKLRIVIELSLTYVLADIALKLTSFLPLTGCAILLSRTKKRISLYNKLLGDRNGKYQNQAHEVTLPKV